MKSINSKFLLPLFTLLFLTAALNIVATAQAARPAPELTAANFRIGDEENNRLLLQNYNPRFDNELNQPKYFFYNEYGNQVLALTGYSKERPFLLVAIDVFAVGEAYQNKHFQLKDTTSFMSESGFFIGARPSVTSLMFAIPNVTGPKEVIKKKGAPDADEPAGKVRTLHYSFSQVNELKAREAELKGVRFGDYTAEYRFYKNKLSRYTLKVNAVASAAPTL